MQVYPLTSYIPYTWSYEPSQYDLTLCYTVLCAYLLIYVYAYASRYVPVLSEYTFKPNVCVSVYPSIHMYRIHEYIHVERDREREREEGRDRERRSIDPLRCIAGTASLVQAKIKIDRPRVATHMGHPLSGALSEWECVQAEGLT